MWSPATTARHAREDESLTVRVIDSDHEEPIELAAGAVTFAECCPYF